MKNNSLDPNSGRNYEGPYSKLLSMTLEEYSEALETAHAWLSNRYKKVESGGTEWCCFIVAEQDVRGAEVYCDDNRTGFTVDFFTRGEALHGEADKPNLAEALTSMKNWITDEILPEKLS